MITDEIRQYAKRLWDYSVIEEPLRNLTVLWCLAVTTIESPTMPPKLFHTGWARYLSVVV